MPLKVFSSHSLFDPRNVAPGCLVPGTLPWLLTQIGESLVPRYLAQQWRGATPKGRAAWPAWRLMALLVLRWLDGGVGRRAACRRAKTDLAWMAAMGLSTVDKPPHEKTVREFEDWLMEVDPCSDLLRYMVVFERILHFFEWGVPGNRTWMADSTPMFVYGALRGTTRLLGDGLRSLMRRWSRITKTSLASLARDWDVVWVMARSIKGGLNIDWRNAEARHEVVHRVAQGVLRVVGEILERQYDISPKYLREIRARCAALMKVIIDDLETDSSGRLVIAQNRVTRDRQVSITDPDARSGRKSNNQPFKGFKLSVLGDLVSGLIAAVTVVKGNAGDGGPGRELLVRAQRMGLRLERLLADSAYGATADRMYARSLGIELIAPPHAEPADDPEVIQKHEFEIDFEKMQATCPAGVRTSKHRVAQRKKGECVVYEWPYETCASCPLREKCAPRLKIGAQTTGRPRKGKRLELHTDEEELRAARAAWRDPELRTAYRRRGEGERLIARMVQYGARQARAFGLAAANLQAHCIAMAANLVLLARRLAQQLAPRPPSPLPLFPDST